MVTRLASVLFALPIASGTIADQPPASDDLPERTSALMVGDAAPPLPALKWLKGGPVEKFEAGRVYVVDFWATWCPGCIAEFPGMTALQDEFKSRGVTVIAVTRPDDAGCTLENATTMVKQRTDHMGFAVGWDTDRTMHTAYMKGSGSGGIPCSFVVDPKGRIAAIGPDPDGLRKILPSVIDGTFDLAAAARRQRLDRISQRDAEAFAKLSKSDESAAYEHLERVLRGPLWDDAGWLSVVVWTITDPKRTRADLDLATRVAHRMEELTPARDNLDVLCSTARLMHVRGNDARAVELQERAIAVNGDNEVMVPSLTKALEEYRAGLKK